MAGKWTKEFGSWLAQYLVTSNLYSVYYDHGDKPKNPSVVAVKGFFGDEVRNGNRLADVDVLVASNNDAILLVEIEESEMPPKKLLGDIFAVAMCNRFAVRINSDNRYFDISSKTHLIVAGLVPNQDGEHNKITDIIMPRLQNFVLPTNAIQINRIKIVTGKDISETLERLKAETKSLFSEPK